MSKHRYLPLTDSNQKEMLDLIGITSVDELFSDIPKDVLFTERLAIKEAASERELTKEFLQLANKNVNTLSHASFLGAGVYDHYIPSVVDHVIRRSEFYTAYTPYQPEISQGELQAIFEFQTMICELTQMDVANSSMYDGATALAEAAMLAVGHTKRKKVLLSMAIHPEYREVVKTYAKGQRIEVVEVPVTNGTTDLKALEQLMDDSVAGVLVQYPNFFGRLEDMQQVKAFTQKNKSLFIVSSNPLSLGVLKPPGEFGADIVTGDVQVFGVSANYGGPHCGFFAVTNALVRKIPGRLVGQTLDLEGRRGFVLTLQAREQHIRRQKATSNICSNQALIALAASVTMSALGKQGVQEVAKQCIQKANYAKQQFKENGFEIIYEGPMFHEFVVKLNKGVKEINKHLITKGFIGGLDLSGYFEELTNCMLICVTEIRTKEEIDQFILEMREANA